MKGYLSLLLVFVFLFACNNKKQTSTYFEYKGFAAGTAFFIEYDKSAGNLDLEICKILKSVEASVTSTSSGSLINHINNNDSILKLDDHFLKLLSRSAEIYKETNRAVDPTAISLTQYWKFDDNRYRNPSKVDSNTIDSIKKYVGFDQIFIGPNKTLIKKNPQTMINFDHIYIGYTVDLIAELLNSYNVQNYKIEVNGRVRTKGVNQAGKNWVFAIDEPVTNPKSRELLAMGEMNNEAYTIAGSYRNYVAYGDKKLSYTIDPRTGYPVQHSLISVMVFAPTCLEAEVYASAFMVMGPEQTKSFIQNHKELKVYLISTNYKGEWITYLSNNLGENIEKVKDEF